MTIIELLISIVIASSILLSATHASTQLEVALNRQIASHTLQSEAIQAFHMMGKAIRHSQKNKDFPYAIMVQDSASMSNSKITHFQPRKGVASVNNSDAFYCFQDKLDETYLAFFIQHQGHGKRREGVLYMQTQNKKGQLQNRALISHVKSMQIQIGIKNNQDLEWRLASDIPNSSINEKWGKVRALKIDLKLQKGKHILELQKIWSRRLS